MRIACLPRLPSGKVDLADFSHMIQHTVDVFVELSCEDAYAKLVHKVLKHVGTLFRCFPRRNRDFETGHVGTAIRDRNVSNEYLRLLFNIIFSQFQNMTYGVISASDDELAVADALVVRVLQLHDLSQGANCQTKQNVPMSEGGRP